MLLHDNPTVRILSLRPIEAGAGLPISLRQNAVHDDEFRVWTNNQACTPQYDAAILVLPVTQYHTHEGDGGRFLAVCVNGGLRVKDLVGLERNLVCSESFREMGLPVLEKVGQSQVSFFLVVKGKER
jgi:hypothetical protein